MYRSLNIAALVCTASAAVSLREAEEFALPQLVVPQGSALSAFGMMPQFRMPEYSLFPDWGIGQSMQQLPSQADAMWSSLISSFDNLMASSMISMPVIDVGDDCVVTVRLSPETNVNDTDIKVYAGERDIELHITSVKIREWRADPEDDWQGPTSPAEEEIQSTSAETESTDEVSSQKPKSKSMLRGFGEMASSTTIRRFPAPAQCDVFSALAKATLDTHTNSLLIKFPVKSQTDANSTGDVNGRMSEKDWQNQGQPAIDLAPMMDKSPEKKSWWSAMFAKDEKKTVPIVKREEF